MSTKENKIEEIDALVGRTHRACQLFEYMLAEVLYEWRIHIYPKKPLELTEAIKEINEIRKSTFKHTTIGPNIMKLQKEGIFEEGTIELLRMFKDIRNKFIHDFHHDYGIELMLIEGNFQKGIFNEEHVEASYYKLKTDLNQIINNMEKAVSLCKEIKDTILRLS